MIRRSFRVPLLLALPLAVVIGACGEDVETGTTCPLLCPGQEITLLDTVFDPAFSLDTNLTGFPLQGLESPILLALRGDTLDARAVVRFDTLVRKYTPVGGDTAEVITHIDSAFLSIRVYRTTVPVPQRVFFEAYDVFDSTIADTARSALVPLFEPGRLLGVVNLDSSEFNDSVRVKVPLDSAKLRAIIENPNYKLRIGLRVHSSESVQLFLEPYFPGLSGSFLEYLVSPDTAIARVTGIEPMSSTPPVPAFVAGDYVDYGIVVAAPDITAPGTFSVGGQPAIRPFLQFDLPLWVTDTVGVLRAQLALTQDPLYGISEADTLSLLVHVVLAGTEVTDLYRAATLLSPSGILTNTLRLVPGDSGVHVIEMQSLVRSWASTNGVRSRPMAIVLRTNTEGSTPLGARFFGMDAADPTLRPRLRVTYTPSVLYGKP